MSVLRATPYLVVLVPLMLAAVLAAGVRLWGGSAPWIALFGPLTAIGGGAASLSGGTSASVPWLSAGTSVLRIGYNVDGLSAVMLLVVGVVAACVMMFSIGYMHGERGYVRYFALLSLFTAAMAGLVIASDLVGLFIGWELVGACSYLLIGFWYDKPAAADAAVKAFLVTRVGDAAIFVGMAILWTTTGTLAIAPILDRAGSLAPAVATAAAVCLLLGAVGKSAQFPLHTWLPDAMEGPTPVSALIHAATMVAAGVFLVARMWPLFEASPTAMLWTLVIGTVTAFGAATIALAQTDIKKVLAYSTISQLGFMFAALGVGAWSAAIFLLVAHAAFKALLFLASGSVIHGSGTQDLREMGGLRNSMPVTTVVWIIGGLALAGIPPTAGFFAKDEVVASVLNGAPWAGVMLMLGSLLTGVYIARATRLAFFGSPRGARASYESPWVMTVPLAVLSVGALTLGFAGSAITGMLGVEGEPLSLRFAAIAVGVAAIGLASGWVLAGRGADLEESSSPRVGSAWRTLRTGYGFDTLVTRAVVRPTVASSRGADFVDKNLIDGFVEGLAAYTRSVGVLLADTMRGSGQAYTALLASGVIVILALTIWLVR